MSQRTAKYKASAAFAGVATAFTLHVVIAVAAGSLIASLPAVRG